MILVELCVLLVVDLSKSLISTSDLVKHQMVIVCYKQIGVCGKMMFVPQILNEGSESRPS